jgi:CDP-glycerol glycerophosphotransferase
LSTLSLSVIVPVHRVHGHLRQCLDSILLPGLPGFVELEVIAVDDASPDGSGRILDEYAERDPRLRVHRLAANGGVGAARTAGLAQATGEYVWFVDGDDYLPEGALEAVAARLAATRPEVLIFDHAYGYWHGTIQPSATEQLFHEPPAPELFTLDERPGALQLTPVIWNRAIRREFLAETGAAFGDGSYSDLTVSYPILPAAQRISLLDRICYIHRQPRPGRARPNHLDVFPQYERVFAAFDGLFPGAGSGLHSALFDRMIWQLLAILERVPAKRQAEFFAAMSQAYRKFRPTGHSLPADEELAAKYRLIERGDLAAFHRHRRAAEVRRRARARVRTGRRKVRGLLRKSKQRARGVYYRARRRQPIDDKLAVYAAYWYRGYSCNPKAIYEKARELAPDIRGVWVVRRGGSVPEGVPHVVAGTKAYYDLVARAKYFVNNVNYPDHVVKRPGQIHVQTHHGTPLKKMGLDQMAYPAGGGDMDFKRLIARSDRWDYVISSNPLSTEAWERCFPCDYEMLEIGYPRNDRFFHYTGDEVARLRAEIGIPEGRKAILYAPTHRDYQDGFQPMFDIGALMRRLGPDYVLLLRAHYFYAGGQTLVPDGQVIDVSEYPVIEDLCLASDALLTDYSSLMFDYGDLGAERPIVIYANDWDTYVRTRGVNFDLLEFPPGVVATTEDELALAFTSGAAWGEAAAKHRADFQQRFCCYDDGQAADRAVRAIFLDETVEQGAQLAARIGRA